MIDLVVGNTRPQLSFRIKRGGVDISTDASIDSVLFKLSKSTGQVNIALVLTAGRWVGNFGVGDLDSGAAGDLLGEVQVTFTDGGVQNGREPFKVRLRNEFAEAAV